VLFIHCRFLFCFRELDLEFEFDFFTSSVFFPDPPRTDDMEVDVNIEGIAKDVAEEARRIAANEAANIADEETTKLAAAEADKVDAAEEGTKAATTETIEAAGGTSTSGAPNAGPDAEEGAADNVVSAIDDPASTFRAPLTRNFLMFLDVPSNPEVPSSSGPIEPIQEDVIDDEFVIPPCTTTEDQRERDIEAEDYYLL
jgi:hypothetical protein